MNNKVAPGLRKLCIFRFATNDENVNLGGVDPENIAYPNLLTVKCPFRILDIPRLQKSTMKSSCGWGWRVHEGPSGPPTKMDKVTTSIVSGTNIITKRG